MMHDSTVLYAEPELHDLTFDPAQTMLVELGTFNAAVPAPEKLERMPEEEHQAILEADVMGLDEKDEDDQEDG